MTRRRGFTLIELLVVVGMIVALATILLPALHRAYIAAARSRMAADLQVIGNALEAYRADFGDYPRPGPSPNQRPLDQYSKDAAPSLTSGPQILCWALVAPGPASEDGADGPGFRLRGSTGTIHGPYLPPDRFMVGTLGSHMEEIGNDIARVIPFPENGQHAASSWFSVLADRRGHVILYYPRGRGNTGRYVAAYSPPWKVYIGNTQHPVLVPGIPREWNVDLGAEPIEDDTKPTWNIMDGPALPMILPPYLFRGMLGAPLTGPGVRPDRMPIDAPYLLISAGTAEPVGRWNPASWPGAQRAHTVGNPFGSAENVANVELYSVDPAARVY